MEPALNPFGHIDLRVASMADALPFYIALMPVLGFATESHSERWKCFDAAGELPEQAFFAITESQGHIANENRIAFWAASRDDVDRAARVVRDAGAHIESGPRACPEYSESYYAVFFRDPSGNRLEVCFRTD